MNDSAGKGMIKGQEKETWPVNTVPCSDTTCESVRVGKIKKCIFTNQNN